MGQPWIDDQERLIGLPGRTIADGHPLFRALRGRTERCFVEVCQLAGYLLAFRGDQGLRDIVVSLRDAAKYGSAVEEVAFAWKFRNAGARIRLGPTTATGIADFGADVEAREHIIEVSGFPSDPFRGDLMAFSSAMRNALKSGVRRTPPGAPIAVEIEIAVGARYAALRKLRQQVHAGVVEVIRDAAGSDVSATRSFAFGEVRVRRAGPHEVPDLNRWTLATCATVVPRGTLNSVVGGIDYRKGKDTDWVYLNVPDEVYDPYEKIRSKLKIESRQLRACTDGMIVLVVNGLLRGTFDEDDTKLRAVIDEFARNHTSTTAIAVVTMPHKRDGTSGVAGAYFELGPTAMSRAFWQKVVSVDSERSALRELDQLE